MYKIGLPNHRKYCSPLQALFWLAEDGELHNETDLLANFSLKKLLFSTWNFDFTFRSDLSKEQILTIINGIKNKEEKERYLRAMNFAEKSDMQDMLLLELEARPNMFSRNVRKIIKQSLVSKNSLRWYDFEVIVERLNAPELLDYYINHNITYKKNRTNSHTPKHTFSHHWGDCDDLAVFGEYILRKGGYKAISRYVHWTADNRGHVGVVIKLEDGGFFLAVDFSGGNRMTGPYTKISEVDERLSHGNIIHDSGWYRPRH